jgi:hypothetical protein
VEFCFDVHNNDEGKMLNAMVTSYDGRVRGGVLEERKQEAGIDNMKVAKSLEDLKCYVHPTTMKSMMEYCADVHDNDEKKMLSAMVSYYDSRQNSSKKANDIRWMQEQIEWLQNNELMKVKSVKTGKEKLVQFKSSGKYNMREDIIGSDGKSVRSGHRQWTECKTWRKETSTDGRITVVADRKAKSLLDKYANCNRSLN